MHSLHITQPFPFIPIAFTSLNSFFGTESVFGISKDSSESIIVVVGSAGFLSTSTNNGNTWTRRDSTFNGSSIFSVSYGQQKFIAVGAFGKLATSTDGLSWTQRSSSFGSSSILSIDYSPALDLWIAVGASGKLATSTDGLSWTQRLSSFGTSFIRSVYVSTTNIIIAAGDDGKLATSSNGSTWTQRNSSFSLNNIFSVNGNYNDSLYIAVGDQGRIATSTNSTTWVQNIPPYSFGSSSIRTVKSSSEINSPVYAGGMNGKFAFSFDGNTWQQRDPGLGDSTINNLLVSSQSVFIVGDGGKIVRGD